MDHTFPSPNIFPLVKQCGVVYEDPFELYGRVTGYSPHSFFIEHDDHHGGVPRRFSYLGCDPYQVVKGKNGCVQISSGGGWEERDEDPFSFLQRTFVEHPLGSAPSFLPFLGGAVGCLSYDLARTFEVFPDHAVDDLLFPDIYFLFVETFVVVDHQMAGVWLVFSPSPERLANENWEHLYREGQSRVRELEAKLKSVDLLFGGEMAGPLSLHIHEGQSASAYQDRVRECQQLIADGDIYQANLSHRFQVEGMMERFSSQAQAGATLYRQLRRMNPSPHSAFLVLESDVIVSNSPERLVRLSEGNADMRPIAGTRPRGRETAADRRLAENLLSDAKERAEHLMLVDLVRNDLGRVCRYGSIHVDEFMTVERYSHVMHLVSHIFGQLREGHNGFDLIRAVFPGGTITGVPKVHCMEIIERLEPVRRGLYTGSIGFIGWNGNVDLNIAIRTLLLTKGCGFLQVGAGIVADSDPVREYEETLHKAQAFFQVLQHAKDS
ncbi:MAG: anthranilate synthase component I family protein [Nitrospirota bacterium]|nr:anthranilate synthase component I family protein [Nitrospirota bacterium]